MSISLPPSADPRVALPVLEREREIAAIHDAVARAATAATGTALVLSGEAGIGKSTLARHAIDEATRRGFRVLRARGGELERALPYGIVIDLFGALVRDARGTDGIFAGPAQIAAPLFRTSYDARQDGHGAERGDPIAYLHGLSWLVLNLVEDGPLAIVVDDAQWADEASLRFLHRVVERVEELPLVVVLAMRPHGDSPASAAADRLRTHRLAAHLVPDPLSEVAVGEVVTRVAGHAVSERLRRAAWVATGGNPFFVTELASELVRTDPEDADPEDVVTHLPERVGRHVETRLAAGGPEARALAEAVAVLGESATLHRAAKLAGLDPIVAEEAARWLVETWIFNDSAALAFRHPIVRGAVDAGIPAPTRSELHRRAALLLAYENVDAGIVGAQLREAAPSGDRRVVELLFAAADEAVGRGEPDTAASLLRRALAEPPTPALRLDALSRLARAEAAAGSPAAAAAFAEAIALDDRPDQRAELRLDLGNALVAAGQWPAARETFAEGLEDGSPLDGLLRTRLEAGYLSAAWVTMEDRTVIGDRVRELLQSDVLGPANRELAAWVAFQQGAVVGSPAHEMGDLVKRVFAEAPVEQLVREGQVVEVGAGVLVETGDLPLEVEILTAAIEAARRTGPIGKVGVYAYCRAWPHYYMGRLTDAVADAEEALRAAELGWEAFVPAAVTVAALAHVERDDLDAAEGVLAIDPERWAGRIDTAMLVPLARGRLALARGDLSGAADHLRQAADGAGAAFMQNPVPTDWRAFYATALLRLDRRDEARAIAAEGLEIARAWGAAWPLGSALRVAGLVEGGPAGIALMREGEALLHESPARLEHARMLVTLGATLRRNGTLNEAREVLSRAADLAQRIGARALLARATTELRAAGSRRRRVALTGVDALTPAELRVANEALAGRTNREIAQVLFVTPKAVEFHLANVYRKLDIGSRSELGSALRSAA
jgi:DNA-binding CsgD family transcriptional regulator